MNVLSLFDGMSCGRIAIDKLGIKLTNYFASEVDKDAIKCSKHNWSDITHIGDVTKVSYKDGVLYTENGEYKVDIDLVIGGSPCQSFSPAAAMKGFNNGLQGKSGLFYEYLRILNEVKEYNPNVNWLLENVKMKKDSKETLDKYLGVTGVYIDSSLLSFQKRSRYYWSNLHFTIPEYKNVSFQDYKESGDLSKYKLNPTPQHPHVYVCGVVAKVVTLLVVVRM